MKTEVGILPIDWKVHPLRKLLKESPKYGINAPAVPLKGNLPTYIRITDIDEDGYFNPDKAVGVSHQLSENYIVVEGDILLARTGASVGKSYIYRESDGKLVYAGFLIKVSPNEKFLEPRYFFQYLKTSSYWRWVSVMSMRSGQPGINGNEYGTLKLPLPPTREEQSAIATALGDADALITQLEKLITKKRQIKQGAMQTLLNPFEGNGKLKHDWSMTTYGQAFDFLSTAAYSRADLGGGDCGYIHYGDIHTDWENHLDVQKVELPTISTEQAKPYAFAQEGDLIMADASEDYDGIGKSVEITGLEGNKVISGLHTFLLRSKGDTFVNGFKGYIHQITSVKQQLNKMATGLKVYGVSKNNLKNIFIPRPPKNDQEKITNILRDMDAEISELACKVKKMKELKQGMMQSLLTGQIRLVDPAPKNEQ